MWKENGSKINTQFELVTTGWWSLSVQPVYPSLGLTSKKQKQQQYLLLLLSYCFFQKCNGWFCNFSFILQKTIKEEKQTVCQLWATVKTHGGEPFSVISEHVSTITLKLLFLCINNKYWNSDLDEFSLKAQKLYRGRNFKFLCINSYPSV